MTMTFTVGWWLAPLLVTVAAFGWHYWVHHDDGEAYGYGAIGQGLGMALTILVAIVVSLIAWLIWALLT